jgi:hypothetical protein
MRHKEMIEKLREAGYAVCAIRPEHIPDGLDASELEAHMEEAVYEHLDNEDEPYEMTDVEADADTLKSAGWGTDEDYDDFREG